MAAIKPPYLWVGVLVVLLLVLVFSDRGLLQALHASRERDALARQVEELEAANRALTQRIEALRNDPATIEEIARRELGMVRPDEIVYQFRSDAPPVDENKP